MPEATATPDQPKKKAKGGIYKFSTGRTNDVLLVSPYDIHIEDGFNCRDWESPANQAHVENIAQLMIANGFDKSKAIHCWYQAKADRILVKDGECRLRAVKRAIEVHGAKHLDRIPITTDKTEDTLFERLLRPITSNTALTPSTYEIAAQIAKIQKMTGSNIAEIAKQTNKTSASINRYIKIYNTLHDQDEILALIRRGVLNVSTALTIVEDAEHDPEKIHQAILRCVSAQQSEDSEKTPLLNQGESSPTGAEEGATTTSEAPSEEVVSPPPAEPQKKIMPRHLQKSGGPIVNLGKALRDLYSEGKGESRSGIKFQHTPDGRVAWIMSESDSRRMLAAAKIEIEEDDMSQASQDDDGF